MEYFMRKMKRVLAVMSVIVMLAALTMPAAASTKTLGQCKSCKQGSMNYVKRIPLTEMVDCYEFKTVLRYGPKGPYNVTIKRHYHYETDLYQCPHCKNKKYVRVKVYD